MATRTTATVEDVLRLASAGCRFELVDGELVEMSPTGFSHGAVERRIGRRFGDFVDDNQLGEVVVGEVLFQLDRNGRLARAADVAFVRRHRLPRPGDWNGAFVGPPDLAVEIVSPGNAADEVQRKVDDWLRYGVEIVLVVYPEQRSIVDWRAAVAVIRHEADELSLDPVLPGFRCAVSELFPPPPTEEAPVQPPA